MQKYKINILKWNLEKYNTTPLFYHKLQILLLMENANTHLVSVFKDYLLFDDMTEFFKEYFNSDEIYPRLKAIYEYYETSSYLFPNYTAINEGKYIYRNIIKKQKLIDYLEDLEDKKKEKEEKHKTKYKNNYQNQNEQSSNSSYIEVFSTKIYDNIRKETWNNSKINDLLGVDNKNNNDGDSFASVLKLTEMIKEKENDKNQNKNRDTKNVESINISNNSLINNNDKKSVNNINIPNCDYIINKKNNITLRDNILINKYNKFKKNIVIKYNNVNDIQKAFDNKIYVSRKVSIGHTTNNKQYIKKTHTNYSNNNNIKNKYITSSSKNMNKNINIYTNIKNNNFNLINRNKNIKTEPSKSNDFSQNNQKNLVQKNNINFNSKSNKNNYKKNNIIINIINNNKSNIFNSNNNYYSNNANNTNDNININNNNIQLSNIYFSNCTNSNEENNIINNINNKFHINHSTKISQKTKKNINSNYINANKNIIKSHISSKGFTTRNYLNENNNYKNLKQISKKEIKSKLLSFRINTDILITDKNLTERMKKQSQQNSIKKGKGKKKIKNIFSPKQNVKKRTKTEITGAQSDIFLLGPQNEIITYNKSINRQILKKINLTNSTKQKKEISLVNKKIINSHFNLDDNNSKKKLKNKYIKHSNTNSQNITSIGLINKIGPLQIKDILSKKGASFFNKTERTSRNHSKENINKTTVKRTFKNFISPKKSQELIYKKINKMQNKNNNAVICSFIRNINLNKKIKNLKTKSKINYCNCKVVNLNMNNKE